jgi:hypothetical protein
VIWLRRDASSSFQTKSALCLIRAPNTGLVIAKTFAGADLPTTQVLEMAVSPKEWPEDEEFCAVVRINAHAARHCHAGESRGIPYSGRLVHHSFDLRNKASFDGRNT